MASFQDFYVPSTTEGLTWRIGFHKPQGRPGVVCATEGECEVHDDVRIFRTVLYQSRHIRHQLSGRATLKAVTDAGRELLRQMEVNGYITSHDVRRYTPCLVK